MSLANLNINVTANVNPVVNAMADMRVSATNNMGLIGKSVQEFQSGFSATAADFSAKSASINSDMAAISNGMSKGAQDASQAISGISEAAKGIQVAGIGQKVSEQLQIVEEGKTRFQQFGEEAKSWAARTATFAGIAFITGVSATVLAAGYAIYKSMSFLGGLFTGESYKSKSIDALIATDKEVQELQHSLQLAAVDANAMNDALARVGVDKSDFKSVYQNVESAIRSNGEELDRLGVKYKDANGKFVETRQVVENAKRVLDEYTDGWDRNAAAASIGFGSYAQLNNYLKINQQELQNSKARLDDYNLGIGTEAQGHIAAYSAAMLAFNNEVKLTAEGFKRAWSDQIMPAATMAATFLKEGWPIAVNVFRYSMAQITSLLYGLKMSFDIVTTSIIGSVKAQYEIYSALFKAGTMALTGDFSGAANVLTKGWNDARATVGKIGSDIVADANKNSAAMKLAWGFDNRGQGAGNGMPGSGKGNGKSWIPKPDKEKEEKGSDDARLWQVAHDKYLAYLKAFSAKEAEAVKAAAQEQLEINKQAWDWGLVGQQEYLAKKMALTVNEIAKEVQLKREEYDRYSSEVDKGYIKGDAKSAADYHEALTKQAQAEKELITLEGKLKIARLQGNDEFKKASFDNLRHLNELSSQLQDLSGDYLSAALSKQQFMETSPEFLRMTKDAQAAQRALWADQNKSLTNNKSAMSGISAAMNDYAKEAQNLGKQMKDFTTGVFRGMEDALVDFVKTGKLSFTDLANSIINDMIRIAIRASITGPLASAFGSINWGSVFGGGGMSSMDMAIAGARAGGGPVSGGSAYLVGERGPELFVPNTSGGIIPNGAMGGISIVVNIENNTGQQMQAKSGGMQFDGKQFVISTIVENVQQNGVLRGMMAGAGAY